MKFKKGDKLVSDHGARTVIAVNEEGYLLDGYEDFDDCKWVESQFKLDILTVLKKL